MLGFRTVIRMEAMSSSEGLPPSGPSPAVEANLIALISPVFVPVPRLDSSFFGPINLVLIRRGEKERIHSRQ